MGESPDMSRIYIALQGSSLSCISTLKRQKQGLIDRVYLKNEQKIQAQMQSGMCRRQLEIIMQLPLNTRLLNSLDYKILDLWQVIKKTMYLWKEESLIFPKMYSFSWVLLAHPSGCNQEYPYFTLIFQYVIVPFYQNWESIL